MKKTNQKPKGFTLIELLIVIAIVAILAAVAFVALDPLTRFQKARDSARWTDLGAIVDAIKLYQVDNGGDFPDDNGTSAQLGLDEITQSTASVDYFYIIGTATTTCNLTTTCDASDATAFNTPSNSTEVSCVDLTRLTSGTNAYLPSIPVSQEGATTWASTMTGYAIKINANGSITVVACESEDTSLTTGDITITR